MDYRNTPFGDPSLDPEERLDWLMNELTMDEKLGLLSSSSGTVERLGLQAMGVGGEAAHGVEARNDQNGIGEADHTTSFPEPIGMSASWDTDLIRRAGETVGREVRVIYHRHPQYGLSRWAPTIDLGRDPRWGRNEECYGEDPVLTGAMASAYIQGMQGDHPVYLRMAATMKHFYANNTEFGRCRKNSSVDPRNKFELYLEPFRRAIQDGGAEGVMTAYNRINGTQGLFNTDVQKLLKDRYGLGHAVSDGGAMNLVAAYSHENGLDAETLARSLKAGVDAMSDDPVQVAEAAREACELGLITVQDVDRALRNMYGLKLRLGIYDKENLNPYDSVTEKDLCDDESRRISLSMAEESAVLLKNDGILPLKRTDGTAPGEGSAAAGGRIALIGPCGDAWYQDWYGGRPPYMKTLKDGLAEARITPEITDGRDRVVFACGDRYLASGENGRLVLSDTPEIFRMDDWGEGAYSFCCERTGKYMNTEISGEAGTDRTGEVYVKAEEIFDWFALEVFHMGNTEDGLVCLQSRFADPFYADASGNICTSPADSGEKALSIRVETVRNGIDEAADAARRADTVILALGNEPMVNSKEETDRSTIAFIPYQQRLADAVMTANPNTVVVLMSDYPYAISSVDAKARAILWMATGSQDMGTAAAKLLTGEAAPAGRLPQTWYLSDEDLPDINDYDIIRGHRTYRYFHGKVLYPFGFGLTYTDFEYGELSAEVRDGNLLHVQAVLTNTGSSTSDEVVSLYASYEDGPWKECGISLPIRQLLAFDRIKDIEPGEAVEVCFDAALSELRVYDLAKKTLVIPEGNFRISIGMDSSCEKSVSVTLRIPGSTPGIRDLTAKIPADHYDRQMGTQITEGCFGYTALMPAGTCCHAEDVCRLTAAEGGNICFCAEYDNCALTPGRGTLRLHMYAPEPVKVKILADGITAGEFCGDTRSYEVRPVNAQDHLPRAVEDYGQLRNSWPVIWADVHIPTDIKVTETPEGRHTLAIETEGPAAFDWFQMEAENDF